MESSRSNPLPSPTKLVCFSVFGNDLTYLLGAVRNAVLYRDLLPDYTPRFYAAEAISERLRAILGDLPCEVVTVSGHRTDWTATMWRFWALREESISHFLFRDCDSRPSDREVWAVRQWEANGANFHAMRDHPAHHAVMLAGMWGCTQAGAALVRDKLPVRMAASSNYHEHYDQAWLYHHVWPRAVESGLVHASYHKTTFGPTVPFNMPPPDGGFIGRGVDHLDKPRYPEHDRISTLCSRCKCTIRCDK